MTKVRYWVDRETGYVTCSGFRYPEITRDHENNKNHIGHPLSPSFIGDCWDYIYYLCGGVFNKELHVDDLTKLWLLDMDWLDRMEKCNLIYKYGAGTYKLTNITREGMAFTVRKHLDKLCKHLGKNVEQYLEDRFNGDNIKL